MSCVEVLSLFFFSRQYYNWVDSEYQPLSARPVSLLLRTLCSLSAWGKGVTISLRGSWWLLEYTSLDVLLHVIYSGVNVMLADYWEVTWFEHNRRGADKLFSNTTNLKLQSGISEGTLHSHHRGTFAGNFDGRLCAFTNEWFNKHIKEHFDHILNILKTYLASLWERAKNMLPNGYLCTFQTQTYFLFNSIQSFSSLKFFSVFSGLTGWIAFHISYIFIQYLQITWL